MTDIFSDRSRPIVHWENQAGPFTIERPTHIIQSSYPEEIKFWGFENPNRTDLVAAYYDVALWRITYKQPKP